MKEHLVLRGGVVPRSVRAVVLVCLRCLQYLQTSCWFLSGQPSRHNSRVTVTETLARHSDFAGGQEPCDRDCSAWPTGGAWSWLFEVTTLGTWISCVCVPRGLCSYSPESRGGSRTYADAACSLQTLGG